MSSNKITSIRIANLAESEDPAIHTMIDYERLKIHGLPDVMDVESKMKYFRDSQSVGRVKIMHVLEDGPQVAVVFKLIQNDSEVVLFVIYGFNDGGKLIELWCYQRNNI